jgi:mycofactocin precursor
MSKTSTPAAPDRCDVPAGEPTAAEEEALTSELLVEGLTIDGMRGLDCSLDGHGLSPTVGQWFGA